jgi:DNA-binding MarR family transcriptional regulator
MTHPTNGLDDVVHQRARLGILAILEEAGRADFSHLRETLELTDGNLSRHLETLEEADLVKLVKRFEERRPRTWVSATPKGRAAFRSELAALKSIISRAEGRRSP